MAANDDVLLLVFRGTKERVDWLTNLRGVPRAVTWCPDGEGCSIHRVSESTWLDSKGQDLSVLETYLFTQQLQQTAKRFDSTPSMACFEGFVFHFPVTSDYMLAG